MTSSTRWIWDRASKMLRRKTRWSVLSTPSRTIWLNLMVATQSKSLKLAGQAPLISVVQALALRIAKMKNDQAKTKTLPLLYHLWTNRKLIQSITPNNTTSP